MKVTLFGVLLITGIFLGIGIMFAYSPHLEISEDGEMKYVKSMNCPPTDNHLYIPPSDSGCGTATGYKMLSTYHTLSTVSLIVGSFFGVFGTVLFVRSHYQNKSSVIK